MNEEHIALGRRAVACRGWKWMPGMACLWKRPGGACGQQVFPTWARVVDLPMGPLPLNYCLVDPNAVYRVALPDFTDPATLGCLLALVREAWGMPTGIIVRYNDTRRWLVSWAGATHGGECGFGDTEAEALVAALEAAPAAGSV